MREAKARENVMAFRSDKADENDYRLLGLSSKASRREVKAAYRRLAKEWHPDRFQQRSVSDREAAEEIFKALTVAYRRIAAGWIDEVSGPEKSRPEGPPSGRAREASASAEGRGDRFDGVRLPLSWLRTRPTLLVLGLLLAAAGLLLLLPPQNSRNRIDPETSPRSEPSGTMPSSPIAAPESDHGNPPGIESSHAPSSRSESSPELQGTGSSATDPGSGVPAPLPHPGFISIGSTQEEVLRIQGTPQVVRGQTWVYGVSELGFKDGRVVRYNNFDGSLRIRVLPSRGVTSPPPAHFSVGSSTDEVLAVQGTPTRMDGNRWTYGFSEVRFKEGKVEEYDNFFGNLKVRLEVEPGEAPGASRGFFTVGSSRDEVIAVQGTPTSIRGNLWYYDMSSVLFKKGKVHYVFNTSGNLRFVPQEELSRGE